MFGMGSMSLGQNDSFEETKMRKAKEDRIKEQQKIRNERARQYGLQQNEPQNYPSFGKETSYVSPEKKEVPALKSIESEVDSLLASEPEKTDNNSK